MAEATDRPASVTGTAPPQASTGVTTALPPPPEFVSEEPYRALSLLAVAGFGVVVVYSFLVLLGGLAPLIRGYPGVMGILAIVAPLAGMQVALLRKKRGAKAMVTHAGLGLTTLACVLGIGGLLAFSGSSPWLMLEGIWGWGLLGVGLFLCILARSQITASEGTLSGGNFANLGLTMGLFFGVVYGAYWLANSLATAGQARARADEFMAQLNKSNDPEATLQAFFLTLPLRSRPTANHRQVAEIEYNTSTDPRGAQPGPLSRFLYQQYVRLLALPDTTYRFERIDKKEFDRGGYKVELIYKVTGPIGVYELSIGTIGLDTVDASGNSRRQWHIDVGRCGIQSTVSQTEEARTLEEAFFRAKGMVSEWSGKVKFGNALGAFLDTLPPAARKSRIGDALLQDPAMISATGLTFAGALGASAGGGQFRDELKKYRDGTIVDISQLWAPREPVKKEMEKEMAAVLRGGTGISCEITPTDSGIPGFKANGDTGEFAFPARIITYTLGDPKGRFVMEGDIVVEGPLKSVPVTVSPYRVTKLRLLRGQNAPDPTKQQPQPSKQGR